MAQLAFIKAPNDTLIPANSDTRDFVHSKIKLGDVITSEFKKSRNPKFHRLYFSLLNLGFEYWTPTGGAISPEEKSLIRGYVNHLAEFAGMAKRSIRWRSDTSTKCALSVPTA